MRKSATAQGNSSRVLYLNFKTTMVTKILKVIAQGEPMYVQSKKSENGQLAKCYIRLKEMGGDYEDEYLCAMYGNLALCKFTPGKLVVAALRFQTHESNGAFYQDIVASEIHGMQTA